MSLKSSYSRMMQSMSGASDFAPDEDARTVINDVLMDEIMDGEPGPLPAPRVLSTPDEDLPF